MIILNLFFFALLQSNETSIKNGQKNTFILNYGTFDEKIAFTENDEPWLVLFHSPDCEFCEQFKPTFYYSVNELLNKGVKFGEVDCQEFSAICERIQLQFYPQLYYFKNQKGYSFHGQRSFSGIKFFIDKGWSLQIAEEILIEPPSYFQTLYTGLKEMLGEMEEVMYNDSDWIQKGVVIIFFSIIVTIFGVFLYACYEGYQIWSIGRKQNVKIIKQKQDQAEEKKNK